jgi:hypothetical protein
MSAQPDSEQRVSPASLWFGVLATPFAWSAQELFSYMVASSVCRLRGEAMLDAHVRALSAPFVLVTAVTLLIALAGVWAGIANWRKTRKERRDSSLDLRKIGAERARFLGRCGMINSIIFIVAFFFTTADILMVPLCAR